VNRHRAGESQASACAEGLRDAEYCPDVAWILETGQDSHRSLQTIENFGQGPLFGPDQGDHTLGVFRVLNASEEVRFQRIGRRGARQAVERISFSNQ
jgi:hypothetical protein